MVFGFFIIAIALYSLWASVKKQEFFWESRKATRMRSFIGDKGTRILYIVLSIVILISGVMLTTLKYYESKADSYYDQGLYEEGLKYYSQLHSILKDDINYLNGLSYGNLMLNRFEESSKYAKIAVDKNKDKSEDSNILLAWSLDKLNKTEEAIEVLKSFVANNESDFAYSELALLETKAGKIEDAIKNYKAAININSKNAIYYIRLSELYFSTQKYQEEIDLYNQMISNSAEVDTSPHDETYKVVYYNMGVSYYTLKEYNNAAQNFQKSISLDSTDPDCFYFLASSQMLLDKVDEALVSLEEAFKLNNQYVIMAKTDSDFAPLLSNKAFTDLLKKYESTIK